MTSKANDFLITEIWTCICLGKHQRLKKALDENHEEMKLFLNATVAEPKCDPFYMAPCQGRGKWTFLRLAVFLNDLKAAKLLMAAGSDPAQFCGVEFSMTFNSTISGLNFKEQPLPVSPRTHHYSESLATHLSYGIFVGASHELIMLMADFGANPEEFYRFSLFYSPPDEGTRLERKLLVISAKCRFPFCPQRTPGEGNIDY